MKKYWCVDTKCLGVMRRLYMRIWKNDRSQWKGTDQWMCEKCGRIINEKDLKKWIHVNLA